MKESMVMNAGSPHAYNVYCTIRRCLLRILWIFLFDHFFLFDIFFLFDLFLLQLFLFGHLDHAAVRAHVGESAPDVEAHRVQPEEGGEEGEVGEISEESAEDGLVQDEGRAPEGHGGDGDEEGADGGEEGDLHVAEHGGAKSWHCKSDR